MRPPESGDDCAKTPEQVPYYSAASPKSQEVWPPPPSQLGNSPGYYPERINAREILIGSILAFFCLGLIMGPWVIIKANKALTLIDAGRANPKDRNQLLAARICGIVATIVSMVIVLIRLKVISMMRVS